MSLAARILADDILAIEAGQQAKADGHGLFITKTGKLVIAPRCEPGWQRIAIKVKSPSHATVETLPCGD